MTLRRHAALLAPALLFTGLRAEAPAAPVAAPGIELSATGAANAAAAAQSAAKAAGVDPRAYLFEGILPDFSENAYAVAVERLLAAYERDTGRSLKPGKTGKVALKLYTESGPGLATPQALTDAVAAAMVKRGFTPGNIQLVDRREERLRECGYLPAIRDAKFEYKGMPVLALDTGKYFDPKPDSPWTYPSALPSKEILPDPNEFSLEPDKRERVSPLPMPLLFGCDFWINLPCGSDNPATGVAGALTNATLQAVGNAGRFADNPANAQKAAVEIASIPELKEKWELSILPLQRYQFVGGPKFDAAFTVSEKRLWLSANPIILDHLLWRRFNANRKKLGFAEIQPEPAMFNAANAGDIRLGSCRPADLHLVKVDPEPAPAAAAAPAQQAPAAK